MKETYEPKYQYLMNEKESKKYLNETNTIKDVYKDDNPQSFTKYLRLTLVFL